MAGEERWLGRRGGWGGEVAGEERWLGRRGGSMGRRGGSMVAPGCKSVVLGSNPAPPQHMANSGSPEVGSHLG